jgi:hypothetical protein
VEKGIHLLAVFAFAALFRGNADQILQVFAGKKMWENSGEEML